MILIFDTLMRLVVRKPFFFAYAKTKTQISFAVTAKLISAFVFATRIVQFLFYLNLKFQASSHLLWLYSPVCVGTGRKPRRPVFSQRGSNKLLLTYLHAVRKARMCKWIDGNNKAVLIKEWPATSELQLSTKTSS